MNKPERPVPKETFAHHYGANHPAMQKTGLGLMIGAIGVVFGDIGTSPIYTLRECFVQTGLGVDAANVYGFLSLIFWALTIVVTIKYAMLLLQANNRGEGGIMALGALALHGVRRKPYLRPVIFFIAIAGMALFYGDGMITPAISVLSAVEGLEIFSADLHDFVVPLSILILAGLFAVQRFGTRLLGLIAGPVTLVWFITLGILGIVQLSSMPGVLAALSPHYALLFFTGHPEFALVVLGAVVLCVTGAEALYSDLGHFGPRPIRRGWVYVVYPCLLLNYFGQGALLLADPSAIESPFYKLVPAWGVLPLVVLATLATIIASQAMITGAFSLTQQAIQLGLLPRMQISHTDLEHRGQIYIPRVNLFLAIGVVLLVLSFQNSSSLAHMYGLAVTGTFLCTTLLFLVVMKRLWRRGWLFTGVLGGTFLIVDAAFFSANLIKVPDGGWVPLLVGLCILITMLTWKRGRAVLVANRRSVSATVPELMQRIEVERPARVPGTAIYMAYLPDVVPYPLLYNLDHNKVLHDRVVLLTVRMEDRPVIHEDERIIIGEEGKGIWHLVIRYGFTESPRILSALAIARRQGFQVNVAESTFFLGRDRIVVGRNPPMARWRMMLFAWMAHTSTSASDYFNLPRARVIELGAQIVL
ncbi:MAG: potassium transporter Kup [Bdellovibrionales bacterium]